MSSNIRNDLRDEIGKALCASTIAYAKNGNTVTPVITQELDLVNQVKWIEKLISKKLTQSADVLFSENTYKVSKRKYIHATKLGEQFINVLRTNNYEIKRHYPLHEFNPYYELFARNVEERHLHDLPWIIKALSDDEVVKWLDILNGCVDSIRKEAHSPKFKNTINEFHRLANKNYRELRKYIAALFEKHSRLLVLRIDLSYVKASKWPSDVTSLVTYDDVKQHWETMLRYLRTKLPNECMCGFAMKIEYALEKNFHCHLMIFLDGSKVREDVTIARIIGEHWEKVVTKGNGIYRNCNAYKEEYKSCGIGMVHANDTVMREGLDKAAFYMIKPDFYIRMVVPGRGRAFSKGNMPKLDDIKLGRPRAPAKSIKAIKTASGEATQLSAV